MKQLLSIITCLLLLASTHAQNTSPCPGLKNPTSFTSGSTAGMYRGYYSGMTGQKNHISPNALTGETGVYMTSGIIPATQLANTTGNGGTSYCGSSLDPTNRFRIMSDTDGTPTDSLPGYDPLTGYNLPYCPTAFDTSIHKSIRIGNCGTGAEAEVLFYTMMVHPQNALLSVYYAIVAQSPSHALAENPSFVIRVARQSISGMWQQISDTLCYAISSNVADSGVDGWHNYSTANGNGLYRDWHKATINLSNYLFEQVRIEIYMSDCGISGHYGYCYVTGDCQSSSFNLTGCNAGASQEVSTITAPADMINYVWYKSNVNGYDIRNQIAIPDSVGFTQLTPDSSTDNSYTCTLNDFIVTQGADSGQFTNNMVFRCDMTSAMDPTKPFITKIYARILNVKPIMAIDTAKTCSNGITLTNQSHLLNNSDGCDIDSTKWWFYNNSQVDSAVGGQVSYHFDSIGLYNIKVRSFSQGDPSCYTDSTYTVLIDNMGTGPFSRDTVYSLSPYTWHGLTYSASGVYIRTYIGPQGCFNVDTLCLIITSDTITVTAIANPLDGGTVTGAGIFAFGNTCTLTAIPDSGFAFANWSDGTAILSTRPTYSFTVSSNIVLTANFIHTQPSNPACPGFKNPLTFTSGSTYGTYVGFYSGQIGSKPYGGSSVAPNALTGETGVNMIPGIIPASQLSNIIGNGSTSYCGSSLGPTNRFRIMSDTDGPGTDSLTGKDPLVQYYLPYCPTAFDTSIHKSIRIGNCGTGAEAEALYYTMDVNSQNALLTLYYAIVAQSPGHGLSSDPSFVVRVCHENTNHEWQQISDTLFYAINSYGVSNGVDGWHQYSAFGIGFYRDWHKININLNNYLYERVRIEIYMSDCAQWGHYGYCYIAGDCHPMENISSGCIAGSTQEVTALTSPAGLDNYVWYKSNIDGNNIYSIVSIPDSVGFTQLTPDSTTDNSYTCTLNDFMVTEGADSGQFTNNMVFRCDITSAMDPTKPYVTKLYSRVINNKPIMAIDTTKTCEGGLTLSNLSYIPYNTDAVDTAATQWWFFNNGQTDSTIGANTSYQFDTSGNYDIKVRSFYRDDHNCYSDSTYTVNIHYGTGTFTSVTVNTPDPYTWHDQTYTVPGTYTYDYVDSLGCSSTDTLHLTLLENCIINTTNLPYFDNFDAYTSSTTANTGVEPPCWKLAHQDVPMTDEYKPMVYYNPETAHSNNYSLILNKRGIYAMPYVDTTICGLRLSFYLMQPQNTHQLQVGVMSDLNDPSSFIPVAIINNSSTDFEYVEVDFSSYTGNGHYIAFRNTLAPDNSGDFSCNHIDDLTIEKGPSQNGIETGNPDKHHCLTLHPNPTTGKLTIRTDEKVIRVNVFDYTGRCIATYEKPSSLDLSRLAAGLYTLRITLPDSIEVRRVIKQ